MVSADSAMVTLSMRSQALPRHDGEQLGEAGADAGAEHASTPPCSASLVDRRAVDAEIVAGDERCRGHDVHARRQDADHLVDVEPHRVVDDAIRFQRQQRVDVVGGQRCRSGRSPQQLADVAADLVRPTRRNNPPVRGRDARQSPGRNSSRRCRSSTGQPDTWSMTSEPHSVFSARVVRARPIAAHRTAR